jgi:hypothetical protein
MGKGSKWRETDYKKYYSNWESIKKKKDNKDTFKEVTVKKGKKTYTYK